MTPLPPTRRTFAGLAIGAAAFTVFGSLVPFEFRPRPDAVAEFQKILDHPGIVFADPVRAVARLQLARALASAGDRTKARAAYQDFLAQWKDADADVRLLQQAKAEYGKVQKGST